MVRPFTQLRGAACLAAVLLAGILSCPALDASGPGTSAVPLLKLDSGARPAALGGMFCSIADDANILQYNPGGLGQIGRNELMLMHNEWIGGIRTETLNYVTSVSEDWNMGLSLNYLFTEKSDARDNAGNLSGGSVRESNGVAALGVGGAILEDFYAGVAVKGLSQSAAGRAGQAGAFDLGIIDKIHDLRMGLSVQNIGTGMKIAREKFPLPLTLRVGANYIIKSDRLPGEKGYVLIGLDAVKVRDSSAEIRLGAELGIENIFTISGDKCFLRVGGQSSRDRRAGTGFTGGFGIRDTGGNQLDYAYSPFGDFGVTHRISVSIRFGLER
ncbi:MAG TPA: hypothetical protein DCL44_04015 [Elusimicrobia bacterium]|nr:hypothetical protein [Elusimicrobiota bacterium]